MATKIVNLGMEPENYSAAYEELQNIINEMEQGNIGIDELSVKVKRAAELINYCKKKTHTWRNYSSYY